MSQDFYSFEKVLKELQLAEDELKRLVSEGEIRAFRDQDTMKFKKEDVDRFRKTSESKKEKTISDEDLPEELVFDEDDANQEVGMATAAIADDSFLEEESPMELEEEPKAGAAVGRRARPSPSAGRRPRNIVIEDDVVEEGPMWKAAIIAATLLCVLALITAMDSARGGWTALTRGIAKIGGGFCDIDYKSDLYRDATSGSGERDS